MGAPSSSDMPNVPPRDHACELLPFSSNPVPRRRCHWPREILLRQPTREGAVAFRLGVATRIHVPMCRHEPRISRTGNPTIGTSAVTTIVLPLCAVYGTLLAFRS